MPPCKMPSFGITGLPGVPFPVPRLLAILMGVLLNGSTCIRSLSRLGDVGTECAAKLSGG